MKHVKLNQSQNALLTGIEFNSLFFFVFLLSDKTKQKINKFPQGSLKNILPPFLTNIDNFFSYYCKICGTNLSPKTKMNEERIKGQGRVNQ